MDITEVTIKKRDLEADIGKMLSEFATETGTKIDSIGLSQSIYYMGAPARLSVEIDARII